MGGWVDGWMGGWVDGWMDGWMVGWVDGWMGGWVDGWMEFVPTCIVSIFFSSNLSFTPCGKAVSRSFFAFCIQTNRSP